MQPIPITTRKPPRLRPNDTIAIIAPSDRPHSPSEVQRACRLVELLGFKAEVRFDREERYGAWTGNDNARVNIFMQAWRDDHVRALWVLRDGWGAARLLPLLDYEAIAARPKILLASGEATALLLAIHQRTGLVTLHAPPLARGALNAFTRTWLMQLLTDPSSPGLLPLPDTDPFDLTTMPVWFHGGVAEGPLLGGQLTELISLTGTPDAPQVDGHVLFVALPQAPPYVLERHLTAMRLAGLTRQCAGLLVSNYAGTPSAETTVTLTLEEALRYGLAGVEQPICYGLPVGEGVDTAALPLGVRVRLDASAGTLELLEGMVEQ